MHEVQGAEFPLDERESAMADRAEQSQPPTSQPEKRCEFWQDAWGRAKNVSPGLSAWAGAKTAEACGIRKRDLAQVAPGFRFLHYRIEGDTLVVTAVLIPDGSNADPRSFNPNAPSRAFVRVPNVPITVVQPDLTIATDANGEARFDLSSEPSRHLVEQRDPVRFQWMVRAAFKDGSHQELAFNPGEAQFFKDEERDKIAAQQKERQTQQRQASHDASAKALQDVEQALRQAGPPWTDAHIASFSDLVTEFKTIDGSVLTAEEKKRYDAAEKKTSTLLADPALTKAVGAAQAKRGQQAIALGRQYILNSVRSPSTLSFVNDALLLTCPGGYVTFHTFDAQNGFGAMIRETWLVELVFRQGALVDARHEQSNTTSAEMARTAANMGGCSRELQ